MISLILTGGILVSSTFILTRRLWLAIGIHFSWNFFQGSILGLPVSGRTVPGLLISELTGSELITGGNFGIEASIITILLPIPFYVFILYRAKQANQIIPSYWKRKTVTENHLKL